MTAVMYRLAAARSLNTLGRHMLSMAVGWELYNRTHSALTLGLVGLVQVFPVIALFLPAGYAADQFNRRHVAAAGAAITGLCGVGIAVVSATSAPIWMYLILLLLLGCGASLHGPSSAAVITTVIPRSQLERYNLLGSSAYEIAAISGPAVAGLLLAVIAPWQVYSLVALCALSSVFFYFLLPPTPPMPTGKVDRSDWRVGLRFIFQSPLLLPALTLDLFAVLFAGVTALLPVVADQLLHTGSIGLGVLRASPSIGALVMAALLSRMKPWRKPGTALLIVVALYGAVTIAFGFSRYLPLSVALLFIGGALDNISVVIRISLEQLVVPNEIRGRVSAVHSVFIGMSNELGELESGVAAHFIGVAPTIVIGGALAMIVVLAISRLQPALRNMPPLSNLRPEASEAQ
jgi:MFS family permease